jgi:hypothetical protein
MRSTIHGRPQRSSPPELRVDNYSFRPDLECDTSTAARSTASVRPAGRCRSEVVEIESGVVSGVFNPSDSAVARRWSLLVGRRGSGPGP